MPPLNQSFGPKIFEACWGHFGVAHSVLNIAMAEIGLERPYETSSLPVSQRGSSGKAALSLNKNWLFGVKGVNVLLLSNAVSCWSRAAASDHTMKISASIATTLVEPVQYSTA